MQSTEIVSFLALQEARRLTPLRSCVDGGGGGDDDDPERDGNFAHICLRRHPYRAHTWMAVGSNYVQHVNGERMTVVTDFLNQYVLPFMSSSSFAGSTGDRKYLIELHDSYTYRDPFMNSVDGGDAYHSNVMVFSRARTHRTPVCIPDPYQMTNYSGVLERSRDTKHTWDNKLDKMFFAGTTTGNVIPGLNARLRMCAWSLRHRNISDFFITKVAQMKVADVRSFEPDSDLFRPPMSPYEHHRYKFAVNIPGNTCSWSRVPEILSSRSVMLDMRHDDMCWYYPAMVDGTHFWGFSDDRTLQTAFRYGIQRPKESAALVDNANRFVGQFIGRGQAALYLQHLLEHSNDLNAA